MKSNRNNQEKGQRNWLKAVVFVVAAAAAGFCCWWWWFDFNPDTPCSPKLDF